jgi:hypothetical protein
MVKLIDWLKIDSKDFARPSVIILILANLVPLYGVIFMDWKVFAVLLVFWLENVIIGVFNVLKMAAVHTKGFSEGASKVLIIPFFCLHYGIFTFVHGMFVFVLFGGAFDQKTASLSVSSVWQAILDLQFGWAVLALLFSHTASFAVNFIGKGEYKTSKLGELMAQPYSRVVILHLTILIGGFLVMTLGAPVIGLIFLLLLKTAIDIVAHLRQHTRKG